MISFCASAVYPVGESHERGFSAVRRNASALMSESDIRIGGKNLRSIERRKHESRRIESEQLITAKGEQLPLFSRLYGIGYLTGSHLPEDADIGKIRQT